MQMVQCGNKMRHSLSTKLIRRPLKEIYIKEFFLLNFSFGFVWFLGGGEKDESSTNSNLQSSSFKSYPHAIHKPAHSFKFHGNQFNKYLLLFFPSFFLLLLLLKYIEILCSLSMALQ